MKPADRRVVVANREQDGVCRGAAFSGSGTGRDCLWLSPAASQAGGQRDVLWEL